MLGSKTRTLFRSTLLLTPIQPLLLDHLSPTHGYSFRSTDYHNTLSGELTWDMPPDLIGDSANARDQGNWVWVPDEEHGYVPGMVLSVDAGGSTQCQLEGGATITLKPKRRIGGRGEPVDLAPLKLSSLQRLEQDLVLLDQLDEGLILHNIRSRYMEDQIYSNIGSICISINPYTRLPLYSHDQMDKYNRRGNRVLPPHVFAVADASFKRLIMDGKSKSILISGESGAGKTEATKQCLSYIAEVAGSDMGGDESISIEQKVLSVNPILEAFGNAKTLRNDNSSRFGRFTEIFFSKTGRISGAKIENYLLEKSRIVFQQGGERNYHIFYQLCADADQRAAFQLGDAGGYQALNVIGCLYVDGMDDAQEFNEVAGAMRDLGFASDDMSWIFSLVAACLHLSNLDFKSDGNEGSVVMDVSALAAAAHLLGRDEARLGAAICTRTMEVRSELMTVPLKPHEAKDGCGAIAKAVYGKLFDWLIQRVNEALLPVGGVPEDGAFIGILDIFGFEIFEQNSFEQLCINFANEWLQRLFNEHTFKEEEAIYNSEEIVYEHVEFVDNLPVLELIEKKPYGLMPVADDEVRTPRATDLTFVGKIDRHHDKNPYFKSSSRTLKGASFFTVSHYAGDVVYNAEGFLAKNRDELLFDMYQCIAGSSSPRTQILFPQIEKKDRKKHSLAGQFRQQLSRLVKLIRTTSTEYIRCIKPNSEKQPHCFRAQMVLEQLRYSGVFEATKIRKTGYPFRYTFERFVEFYKCIMLQNGKWAQFRSAPDDHLGRCREIIATTGQPPEKFANLKFGRTMLLYQSAEHRLLSLLRNLSLERVCSMIQCIARGMVARRFVGKMRETRPILEAAIASKDIPALTAAIDRAVGIFGAYGHMVSVESRELVLARRLREALEAWETLAVQLDNALRQDLQDEMAFENLFSLIKQADDIADIDTTDYHKVRRG